MPIPRITHRAACPVLVYETVYNLAPHPDNTSRARVVELLLSALEDKYTVFTTVTSFADATFGSIVHAYGIQFRCPQYNGDLNSKVQAGVTSDTSCYLL